MTDATFEDGAESPLRLVARDDEDLKVMAALTQDAVLPGDQLKFDAKARRFALLLNRFRWEDPARRTERVQSLLTIEDVTRVQSTGVSRDPEMLYSLLTLTWTPTQDGAGRVEITLAGDGALGFEVECLEVMLRDVTRPYRAPSGQTPRHPD